MVCTSTTYQRVEQPTILAKSRDTLQIFNLDGTFLPLLPLKPSAHSTIFVAGNRDLVFCRQRRKRFVAYLILKIVVSDKNLLYVFPAYSKFSSPAKKIFVLSDENSAVCARLKQCWFLREVHAVKGKFFRAQ